MNSIRRSGYQAVEWVRSTLRPVIKGTRLYRLLQIPSQWIRKQMPDYRTTAKDSIFYREEELAMCSLFPKEMLDWIVTNLRPRSVLDIGSGVGVSLDYLLTHGVDAQGIEGSALAISKARNPGRITRWNLNRELNLGRKFDLVYSCEVVEHIHPDYVEHLVRTFTNHSDILVLTAAQPGQGGLGHFNEQPPAYWIEHFAKHGFALDQESTRALKNTGASFSENALCFRRNLQGKNI